MSRVIPVLDLLGGRVVRAVGGRRHEYQPLTSPLLNSCEPLAVAAKLLESTQAGTLYVADLDAITSRHVSPWPRRLADAFPHTRILIDFGVRTMADVAKDWPTNVWPVVGTETLASVAELRQIAERVERFVVSVDLKNGELLGHPGESLAFTNTLLACGTRSLILLDLASVGESRGPSSVITQLIASVKRQHPEVEIITGGGVRDWPDVEQLHRLGADAVLVSTAIHRQTLTFPRPRGS
jgi:phosphoribosylformimino-5-aminoimidazole carboxamide ribotide isomerase